MKIMIDEIDLASRRFESYFVLADKNPARTSSNKPYVSVRLSDRTGELPGKLWDTEDVNAEPGEVVTVRVESVDEYPRGSGRLQLTIRSADKRDQFDLADLLPISAEPPADILADLEQLIQKKASPLIGDVLLRILEANKEAFLVSPAASKNHHAYVGGLLDHVRGIVRAAILMKRCYPELDLDILLAGAILHDIGKLHEISPSLGFRYTVRGKLFGHVAMGFDIAKHALEFASLPDQFVEDVLHIVASHHGALEHGAARLPCTREAIAFHLLDKLDAQMAAARAAENGPFDPDGFSSAFLPTFETRYRKGRQPTCQTIPLPPAIDPPPPDQTSIPEISPPLAQKQYPD